MVKPPAPTALPRMRWWAPPVVAVGLVIATSGCSGVTDSVVGGSGTLRTETRQVQDFTTIDLSGSGSVIIEQTGTESLSIEAEDNLLPHLTSAVSDGTLRLGTEDGADLGPTLPVTYRISVEDLAGLQLSGSGSVTAAEITTPAISIDISGSGKVTLDGTADSQTITISGSGDYIAGGLDTRSATVAISGSGSVIVSVRDVLAAEISGSGDVTYAGSPDVSDDIRGSGQLLRAG